MREKLLTYKSLPSLRNYLVVDSKHLLVRHFWRDDNGKWQQQTYSSDGSTELACLKNTINLNQIYNNVF